MPMKSEFVLTLMSSFAQEESKSISENCMWGQRKRFADGKVSVSFARFLGYDRGKNGELIVNEEEAKIVEYIYSLFILGFNRFNATKARLDDIKQTIIEKQSKCDEVEDFIQELEKQELISDFDKNVWLSMVDYLTVHHDGKIEVTFLDGSQIELNK